MDAESAHARPRALPRWWRDPALWGWLAAALGVTALFRGTGLDLAISGAFHDAERGWLGDRLARRWPFVFDSLHVTLLGAWIAASLVLAARRRSKLGAYMLALSVVGAGVVVNLILKDHAGRPRPEQIEAFGGLRAFQPVLDFGLAGRGKSFPSGHAAIGFLALGLWHAFRLARPSAAWTWLAVGLVAGLALGWMRVAAGAHFASDVAWAGLIVWITGWGLARVFPAWVEGSSAPSPSPLRRAATRVAGGALVAAAAGFALVAKLHFQEFRFQVPPAAAAAVRALELSGGDLRVTVRITPEVPALRIQGFLRGFGWPSARVDASIETLGERVVARFTSEGYFTELGGAVEVEAPPGALDSLAIRLEHGGVEVEAPPGTPPPAACSIEVAHPDQRKPRLPAGWGSP